jgi:hypothetical protein
MKKAILLIAMSWMLSSANGQTLTQEERSTMRLAESEGYVTCNCSLNKIMIKPVLWNQLPYESKRNMGAMYAIKCANEKKSNLYYINIHDYYSGKKIAKYSQSFGFEIY